MPNDHITSLGYRVELSDDPAAVTPLLNAVNLEPHLENAENTFLMACTSAGGIAACAGWSRIDRFAVLHSLAVAPPSRGSGVGMGLLASAMAHIMDNDPVDGFYLTTASSGARRTFGKLGFHPVDNDDVPEVIGEHPEFSKAIDRSVAMARTYGAIKRGLDNCAFRLITNDTEDATLPLGSVFLFRQTGGVIESSYRGGRVVRGHLLGAIDETEELKFCWHQYTKEGSLMKGDGQIVVKPMDDGRRELTEQFSSETTGPVELLLREV